MIVNFIVNTNLDYCENNKKNAYELNVLFIEKICKLCNEINSKFIHISSDYVFDGKNGNYNENDQTNPVNYYGYTKQLSEKTNIKLTSGLGYSSQGATVVDVNKTSITNNLKYLQIPILINFRFYKISFLFGPQISFLNSVNTNTKNSTILSLNALGNNPDFSYKAEDFSDRDNGFVFGLEYEISNKISASVKYITSLKNISIVPKETWKNKTIEISVNYTLMDFILNDKSIK